MSYVTLAITPREDAGSQMLGDWWSAFHDVVQGQWRPSYREVIVLSGGAATRQNVQTELSKNAAGVDIVAFFGNGTRCSVCVRNNSGRITALQQRMYNPPWYCNYCRRCFKLPVGEFLIDPDNAHLCGGRAMYVVACCSAEALGRILIQLKVPETAFFGYLGEIWDPYYPDLREEIQKVVVQSLQILHDRWTRSEFTKRCKATEEAVKHGFAQLKRRIRTQAKGRVTGKELLASIWSLNFVAWYGSRAPT